MNKFEVDFELINTESNALPEDHQWMDNMAKVIVQQGQNGVSAFIERAEDQLEEGEFDWILNRVAFLESKIKAAAEKN